MASTGASWHSAGSSPDKGSAPGSNDSKRASATMQSTAPLMRAFTGSSPYGSPTKTFQKTATSTLSPGASFRHLAHDGSPKNLMRSTSDSGFTAPKPGYEALGNRWRATGTWNPNRSFVTEGEGFIGGAVPSFIKGHQVRTKEAIGHHLGWAYYRTKRYPEHPLRSAMGSDTLPPTNVVSALRDNTPGSFNFWRDLRPPFDVVDVRRLDMIANRGVRYEVEYECGLDFETERSWGDKQDGGTFDNKVHGIVLVLLPDKWPIGDKQMEILEWGPPVINWTPPQGKEQKFVDIRPAWHYWLPLARELNERPTATRFKSFRLSDTFAHDYVQPKPTLDPVSQALLGRHDFQKIQKGTGKMESESPKSPKKTPKKSFSPKKVGSPFAAELPSSKETPKRRHTIFTAAAGFVPYDG